MNYFGHAVMAHAYRPDPAFVLGAMLPDLMHFSDEPLDVRGDDALKDGVAFHHRTDAIFHESPSFVAWCQDALEAARRVGVSKGPARGMTHLVVELIIDAKLAAVPLWQDVYMTALASRPQAIAPRARLVEGLDWLVSRGPSLHNDSSERLATALRVTLRGRPRLCPSEDELRSALSAWMDLPARVDAGLPKLLSELAPLFPDGRGSTQRVFGEHLERLQPSKPAP